MFHTWEVSRCPTYVQMPPVCLDIALTFGHILYVQTPPHVPMLPCASACSRGYLDVIGALGSISTSVRLLLSVSTSIGCPLCFIMYFLVVHCLKSLFSTAMTTTPPVTVLSSCMVALSTVTMGPSLRRLPTMLGQHDVVLPPPLTPGCSGGVLGHASLP